MSKADELKRWRLAPGGGVLGDELANQEGSWCSYLLAAAAIRELETELSRSVLREELHGDRGCWAEAYRREIAIRDEEIQSLKRQLAMERDVSLNLAVKYEEQRKRAEKAERDLALEKFQQEVEELTKP